ncbi:MAG: hypothetical protein A2381_01745 [Bdellovibrionales bacterium RIFOXYB1_FULL_37_110]|nr:MAG: hypothetical protein A2417_15770 [Bdellovibrionales bacterium RIFOXYC1_FULL_37_79]OFZ58938.1 MAG: hypothetical protein A2381_01745 [Bdellovibrionales bacterium RIFOXYB1_FULL_37_110]OFZ64616.1 MAG: hypothetical protein A2577_13190 [Bdellovibrionales bacterium RIFOXYD1_FULL_36_51]
MNKTSSSRSFEMAMLATFLNNEKFNELIKNKEFQNFLSAQKELVADLLISGFNLSEVSVEEKEMVMVKVPVEPIDLTGELVKTKAVDVQPLNTDSILATVTDICSEITGYPKDMLDPGLDLEADLGIDTVKQIEILSILKEKYHHKIEDNFVLSSTPTINDVTKYLLRA